MTYHLKTSLFILCSCLLPFLDTRAEALFCAPEPGLEAHYVLDEAESGVSRTMPQANDDLQKLTRSLFEFYKQSSQRALSDLEPEVLATWESIWEERGIQADANPVAALADRSADVALPFQVQRILNFYHAWRPRLAQEEVQSTLEPQFSLALDPSLAEFLTGDLQNRALLVDVLVNDLAKSPEGRRKIRELSQKISLFENAVVAQFLGVGGLRTWERFRDQRSRLRDNQFTSLDSLPTFDELSLFEDTLTNFYPEGFNQFDLQGQARWRNRIVGPVYKSRFEALVAGNKGEIKPEFYWQAMQINLSPEEVSQLEQRLALDKQLEELNDEFITSVLPSDLGPERESTYLRGSSLASQYVNRARALELALEDEQEIRIENLNREQQQALYPEGFSPVAEVTVVGTDEFLERSLREKQAEVRKSFRYDWQDSYDESDFGGIEYADPYSFLKHSRSAYIPELREKANDHSLHSFRLKRSGRNWYWEASYTIYKIPAGPNPMGRTSQTRHVRIKIEQAEFEAAKEKAIELRAIELLKQEGKINQDVGSIQVNLRDLILAGELGPQGLDLDGQENAIVESWYDPIVERRRERGDTVYYEEEVQRKASLIASLINRPGGSVAAEDLVFLQQPKELLDRLVVISNYFPNYFQDNKERLLAAGAQREELKDEVNRIYSDLIRLRWLEAEHLGFQFESFSRAEQVTEAISELEDFVRQKADLAPGVSFKNLGCFNGSVEVGPFGRDQAQPATTDELLYRITGDSHTSASRLSLSEFRSKKADCLSSLQSQVSFLRSKLNLEHDQRAEMESYLAIERLYRVREMIRLHLEGKDFREAQVPERPDFSAFDRDDWITARSELATELKLGANSGVNQQVSTILGFFTYAALTQDNALFEELANRGLMEVGDAVSQVLTAEDIAVALAVEAGANREPGLQDAIRGFDKILEEHRFKVAAQKKRLNFDQWNLQELESLEYLIESVGWEAEPFLRESQQSVRPLDLFDWLHQKSASFNNPEDFFRVVENDDGEFVQRYVDRPSLLQSGRLQEAAREIAEAKDFLPVLYGQNWEQQLLSLGQDEQPNAIDLRSLARRVVPSVILAAQQEQQKVKEHLWSVRPDELGGEGLDYARYVDRYAEYDDSFSRVLAELKVPVSQESRLRQIGDRLVWQQEILDYQEDYPESKLEGSGYPPFSVVQHYVRNRQEEAQIKSIWQNIPDRDDLALTLSQRAILAENFNRFDVNGSEAVASGLDSQVKFFNALLTDNQARREILEARDGLHSSSAGASFLHLIGLNINHERVQSALDYIKNENKKLHRDFNSRSRDFIDSSADLVVSIVTPVEGGLDVDQVLRIFHKSIDSNSPDFKAYRASVMGESDVGVEQGFEVSEKDMNAILRGIGLEPKRFTESVVRRQLSHLRKALDTSEELFPDFRASLTNSVARQINVQNLREAEQRLLTDEFFQSTDASRVIEERLSALQNYFELLEYSNLDTKIFERLIDELTRASNEGSFEVDRFFQAMDLYLEVLEESYSPSSVFFNGVAERGRLASALENIRDQMNQSSNGNIGFFTEWLSSTEPQVLKSVRDRFLNDNNQDNPAARENAELSRLQFVEESLAKKTIERFEMAFPRTEEGDLLQIQSQLDQFQLEKQSEVGLDLVPEELFRNSSESDREEFRRSLPYAVEAMTKIEEAQEGIEDGLAPFQANQDYFNAIHQKFFTYLESQPVEFFRASNREAAFSEFLDELYPNKLTRFQIEHDLQYFKEDLLQLTGALLSSRAQLHVLTTRYQNEETQNGDYLSLEDLKSFVSFARQKGNSDVTDQSLLRSFLESQKRSEEEVLAVLMGWRAQEQMELLQDYLNFQTTFTDFFHEQARGYFWKDFRKRLHREQVAASLRSLAVMSKTFEWDRLPGGGSLENLSFDHIVERFEAGLTKDMKDRYDVMTQQREARVRKDSWMVTNGLKDFGAFLGHAGVGIVGEAYRLTVENLTRHAYYAYVNLAGKSDQEGYQSYGEQTLRFAEWSRELPLVGGLSSFTEEKMDQPADYHYAGAIGDGVGLFVTIASFGGFQALRALSATRGATAVGAGARAVARGGASLGESAARLAARSASRLPNFIKERAAQALRPGLRVAQAGGRRIVGAGRWAATKDLNFLRANAVDLTLRNTSQRFSQQMRQALKVIRAESAAVAKTKAGWSKLVGVSSISAKQGGLVGLRIGGDALVIGGGIVALNSLILPNTGEGMVNSLKDETLHGLQFMATLALANVLARRVPVVGPHIGKGLHTMIFADIFSNTAEMNIGWALQASPHFREMFRRAGVGATLSARDYEEYLKPPYMQNGLPNADLWLSLPSGAEMLEQWYMDKQRAQAGVSMAFISLFIGASSVAGNLADRSFAGRLMQRQRAGDDVRSINKRSVFANMFGARPDVVFNQLKTRRLRELERENNLKPSRERRSQEELELEAIDFVRVNFDESFFQAAHPELMIRQHAQQLALEGRVDLVAERKALLQAIKNDYAQVYRELQPFRLPGTKGEKARRQLAELEEVLVRFDRAWYQGINDANNTILNRARENGFGNVSELLGQLRLLPEAVKTEMDLARTDMPTPELVRKALKKIDPKLAEFFNSEYGEYVFQFYLYPMANRFVNPNEVVVLNRDVKVENWDLAGNSIQVGGLKVPAYATKKGGSISLDGNQFLASLYADAIKPNQVAQTIQMKMPDGTEITLFKSQLPALSGQVLGVLRILPDGRKVLSMRTREAMDRVDDVSVRQEAFQIEIPRDVEVSVKNDGSIELIPSFGQPGASARQQQLFRDASRLYDEMLSRGFDGEISHSIWNSIRDFSSNTTNLPKYQTVNLAINVFDSVTGKTVAKSMPVTEVTFGVTGVKAYILPNQGFLVSTAARKPSGRGYRALSFGAGNKIESVSKDVIVIRDRMSNEYRIDFAKNEVEVSYLNGRERIKLDVFETNGRPMTVDELGQYMDSYGGMMPMEASLVAQAMRNGDVVQSQARAEEVVELRLPRLLNELGDTFKGSGWETISPAQIRALSEKARVQLRDIDPSYFERSGGSAKEALDRIPAPQQFSDTMLRHQVDPMILARLLTPERLQRIAADIKFEPTADMIVGHQNTLRKAYGREVSLAEARQSFLESFRASEVVRRLTPEQLRKYFENRELVLAYRVAKRQAEIERFEADALELVRTRSLSESLKDLGFSLDEPPRSRQQIEEVVRQLREDARVDFDIDADVLLRALPKDQIKIALKEMGLQEAQLAGMILRLNQPDPLKFREYWAEAKQRVQEMSRTEKEGLIDRFVESSDVSTIASDVYGLRDFIIGRLTVKKMEGLGVGDSMRPSPLDPLYRSLRRIDHLEREALEVFKERSSLN